MTTLLRENLISSSIPEKLFLTETDVITSRKLTKLDGYASLRKDSIGKNLKNEAVE